MERLQDSEIDKWYCMEREEGRYRIGGNISYSSDRALHKGNSLINKQTVLKYMKIVQHPEPSGKCNTEILSYLG